MTSKEALAQLQENDVVAAQEASSELTCRSSEQADMVSGHADTQSPAAPSVEAAGSMEAPSLEGASLLESAELENLEITPNLGGRRGDTIPEWMLGNDEPAVAAVSLAAPARKPRSSRRPGWVAALALVAAGTWWFAADGVNALSDATPSVVAAAPALAAPPSQVKELPAVPEVNVVEAPTAAPTVSATLASPVPSAKPKLDQGKSRRRRKSTKRAPKASAKTASRSAKAPSKNTVSGLVVGQAASGRGCRAISGTILASENERVNVCFKVHAAPSLKSVRVQWRHNGALVRSTEHDLSAKGGIQSIRAFSRVQSAQSGNWSVQVRTSDGRILASKRFSVGM